MVNITFIYSGRLGKRSSWQAVALAGGRGDCNSLWTPPLLMHSRRDWQDWCCNQEDQPLYIDTVNTTHIIYLWNDILTRSSRTPGVYA